MGTSHVTSSLKLGSGGTALSKWLKGTVAVTISALAAAAEEDLDVTVTGAAAGDIVIVTPLEATMEAGVAILGSWVVSANTVTIRVGNTAGTSLTGSTTNFSYLIIKS